tara:strand:- start:6053 stop:6820 length:768 start_codon:yes stop_codon:yes gene_type:complete
MPISCGININLNNFQGQIGTQISAILNLDLGTPAGIAALSSSINSALSTVTTQLGTLIPTAPVLTSLREELNALSQLTFGSTAAVGKILSIVTDFADAVGLQGYVNLNLTDLANSIFALGVNFDPCANTIPNIFRDSNGVLQQLPNQQPKIGQSVFIQNLEETLDSATDEFASLIDNVDMAQVGLTAQQGLNALETNIQTSVSALDNSLRQLPTGEEIIETQNDFLTRLEEENFPIIKEIPKSEAERSLPISLQA